MPIRPFYSTSIDLIDKSNQASLVLKKGLVKKSYHYIFVIVDNFSRYMYCYPLENKQPRTLMAAFMEFNNDIFVRFPFLNQLDEPIVFVTWTTEESSSVSLKKSGRIKYRYQ
jgi:hypothetical protein